MGPDRGKRGCSGQHLRHQKQSPPLMTTTTWTREHRPTSNSTHTTHSQTLAAVAAAAAAALLAVVTTAAAAASHGRGTARQSAAQHSIRNAPMTAIVVQQHIDNVLVCLFASLCVSLFETHSPTPAQGIIVITSKPRQRTSSNAHRRAHTHTQAHTHTNVYYDTES